VTTASAAAAELGTGISSSSLPVLPQLLQLARRVRRRPLGRIVQDRLGIALGIIVQRVAGEGGEGAGRAAVADAALGGVEGRARTRGLDGVGQGEG